MRLITERYLVMLCRIGIAAYTCRGIIMFSTELIINGKLHSTLKNTSVPARTKHLFACIAVVNYSNATHTYCNKLLIHSIGAYCRATCMRVVENIL